MRSLEEYKLEFKKPVTRHEAQDFVNRLLETSLLARHKRENGITGRDAVLIHNELQEIAGRFNKLIEGDDLYTQDGD